LATSTLPRSKLGSIYRSGGRGAITGVSYSASKKRGGGVALDLSHEIDYMRFLFGDPHSSKVVKAKVSNLTDRFG